MTLTKQPVMRLLSLFLLVFLLFGIFPVQSLAADSVIEEEVEISGKYNGTFSLDSSDMELFNLKNVVPGDTWKGKLHIRNTAIDKMEIAILSIVSNLDDNVLYDALDLKISIGTEEIYNGSYGATKEPISRFYEVPAGGRVTFDIVVSLPKTAGNNIQNKKMDSTWTFEGRYYGGGGSSRYKYTVDYVDEDGNKLLKQKVGYGYLGNKIVEKAPTIKGYTVDENTKSVIIQRNRKNEIVFVYSPDKTNPGQPSTPVDPQDPTTPTDPTPSTPPGDVNPPDEPITPGTPDTPNEPGTPGETTPDTPSKEPSVQTGVDKTDSNSAAVMWLVIFGLCLIGGIVLFARIRAEQTRVNKQKSKARRTK